MATAVRSDPRLWESIKQKWLRGSKGGVAGRWNARKAMLAVNEYKRRGGRYVGRRHPANSLKKWERERWGYIDGDPSGRYLPEAVRRQLTGRERSREKALKRGKKGTWVPYSPSVNEKMRRAGIYETSRARRPLSRQTAKGKARPTAAKKARPTAAKKARPTAAKKARPTAAKKARPAAAKKARPSAAKKSYRCR